MSTHKSTHMRYWISIMVLLYLVASLLPAHVLSAADQAATCDGEGIQAAHAVAGVAANQEVEIPKELVDSSIFQAIWRTSYDDVAAIEGLITAELSMRIPTLSLAEHDRAIQELFDKYEELIPRSVVRNGNIHSYDQIIHTMLNVALEIPALRAAVPGVWGVLQSPQAVQGEIPGAVTAIVQSANRFRLSDRLLNRAPEILSNVYKCAQKNPTLASAFDKQNSEQLGTSIKDDSKTMLRKKPNLAVPAAIKEMIENDKAVRVSLNELTSIVQTEFNLIDDSISDIRETLVEIDKKQTVIIDYLKNQEERARMQALAAAKAAEHKLKLEAANSSVFILATLVGFIDEDYGKGLATVGKSALTVYQSVTGWMDAVAGLSTLDKVGSLSTVVMTGNVLGAVMNVVSLFGAAKPTPEQMILAEIGKLRQQVEGLRTEMHGRFDRIDAELNTIYTTMQDRFNLIDVQLGKINGNIEEVQKSLIALDLKLSRIERNNFEFLDALGRRPLLDAINGGLNYQERTGLPMPYQPEFIAYENVLQTWGTIHAFDALATGPTQRDYSPGALLGELNAYPMDANLNYLNGWLQANGYPALSNKRLPSPRDWLFATRAYTQLGLEWPAHMQRIDPQRQAQLDTISADMEAALHNISTRNTLTGTVGNELLFTNVITYYQSRLDNLDLQLQQAEAAYVQRVWGQNGLNRQVPFELYGGVDQALNYKTPGLNELHNGPDDSLAAPSNLAAHIANFNRYNLAEYLAITTTEQIRVVGTAYLADARSVPGCRPDPDVCPLIGDLVITVWVAYGQVPLVELELQAGRTILPVIRGNVEEATAYLTRNWVDLKPRFEARATVVEPSPAAAQQRATLLNSVTLNLEERLAFYQKSLYRQLSTSADTGPLRPFFGEVAGGKTLLDSFVTLGLPRAVEHDDLLRAMLYGNQQLVNDNQILQTYALSSTQPITGANLLVNPRLVLGQVADQRTAAFSGLIDHYLDAISAQTHVEASDYIANARRELDLTMRLAGLDEQPPLTPVPPVTPIPPLTPVPPSTDPKQLYLPLITR